MSLPQNLGDVLEPGDQRRRQKNAGDQHQARCANIGT